MPSLDDKPRPVDALFGESNAPASTNYVVEPPQPVTTVAPPPPDPNAPAPASTAPRAAPDIVATLESSAPSFDPEPIIVPHAPAASSDDRFTRDLLDRISQLYVQVKEEMRDSRVATSDCHAMLRKAREAHVNRDFATAEFYVESVQAKLKRNAASQQASRQPIVWLVWLWQLAALAAAGMIVAISYILNLTLFGLPVAPEGIVLLRAMAWGAQGGVLGAMWNIVWSVRHREYDSANNLGYFARPIVGAVLGAVLFLLSAAGVIAGDIVIGDVSAGPLFLYVFAVIAGLTQDSILEFFLGLFRKPKR
jgi:hypothetical protein